MVTDMHYWSKVIRKILVRILIIVLVFVGFKISIFYLPFLIAFFLSLLIEPIIRFSMKKLKLKRRTSAIIVFSIVIIILIGLLVFGIVTLVSEATNFLNNFNEYYSSVTDMIEGLLEKLNSQRLSEVLPKEVSDMIGSSTQSIITEASNWIKNLLSSLINAIGMIPKVAIYVVMTFMGLYFMCTDKIYMLDQLEHHLPERWMKKLTIHIRDLSKTLGQYLKAEGTLILISFIISLIGFTLFKVFRLEIGYPLLIAIGIAFVDALPIFGSGTIMLPWAIISAFSGDITLAIAIFVLWIIMSVIRQLIEPKIVSGKIGIHPIFTILAMYTGYKFMGVTGMFIGPIMLIIIKNIFSSFLDKGFVKSIVETE